MRDVVQARCGLARREMAWERRIGLTDVASNDDVPVSCSRCGHKCQVSVPAMRTVQKYSREARVQYKTLDGFRYSIPF